MSKIVERTYETMSPRGARKKDASIRYSELMKKLNEIIKKNASDDIEARAIASTIRILRDDIRKEVEG